MASGIDWFRWHHGSVTDPKFALVAKKTNCRVSDVLAMWAFLLESASSSEKRGTFEKIDFESVDLLFGFDDGQAEAIFYKMIDRGLIDESAILSWNKRQPKRERPEESSTERVKRFRNRKENEQENNVTPNIEIETELENETPCNATLVSETPCNAMKRQETPRGEESREDIKTSMRNSSASDESPDPITKDFIDGVTKPIPNCPQDQILAMYHRKLPMLPNHRTWEGARAEHLRARWRWVLTHIKPDGSRVATNKDEALEFFDDFFSLVRDCPFLLGQAQTARDRPFFADLEWLMKPSNFAKVLDEKYLPAEVRA